MFLLFCHLKILKCEALGIPTGTPRGKGHGTPTVGPRFLPPRARYPVGYVLGVQSLTMAGALTDPWQTNRQI